MRALALAVALVACGPALALSCMRPDVARTFQQAQESDDAYVVVHGQLTFDQRLLPKQPKDNPNATQPDTLIPARIDGRSLSTRGFLNAFDHNVTLYLQCFGPWCGRTRSGTDYLAFLKKTEAGYLFEVDPCGGSGFAQPTRDQLDTVMNCMQGGDCAPQDF